jgi:hypothetical protein
MAEENTLHAVLGANVTDIKESRRRLKALPKRSEQRQSRLPQTFSEASQYVQLKEEERKRREAKKEKQKQRCSASNVENGPGMMPGPPDTSAFWLVSEVMNQ